MNDISKGATITPALSKMAMAAMQLRCAAIADHDY